MTTAPTTAEGHRLTGHLGPVGIVFMVVAAAAPLTVIGGKLGGRVVEGSIKVGDTLNARDRCGDGVHEHGGRIKRAPAGNVDAYGFERGYLRTDDRPVLARGNPALLLLTLVELADLRGGMLERGDRLRVALGSGGIDRAPPR